MPIARFEMPDGRIARFEVPDGTTPEQAQAMIAAELPKVGAVGTAPTEPVKIGKDAFPDALREVLRWTDWGTRNIAGAGTALSNLGQGLKQFVGMEDQGKIAANRIIRDEAPVGAIAGDVALTAAPFAMVGKSIPAAAAVGGGYGLTLPVEAGNWQDVAKGKALNTGIGAATGAGGQWVANKASGFMSRKAAELSSRKAKNALIDETLKESIDAGYKVPPSMMPDSGVASRLAEGMSGKYKTNQLMGIKNQQTTNNLARQALGLPDDAPLSVANVEKVREAAYAPYKEIASLQPKQNVRAQSAYTEWDAPIQPQRGFDPKAKLEALKQSRADAKAWFESYNRSMNPEELAKARAFNDAAESIEGQIENYASSLGRSDLVPQLREARKMIAKTYTVERALQKGSGNVDAKVLGRLFEKQKPLSDGLDKVGKFGATFGDVAGVPKSGNANPLTAVDFMQGGISGPLGFLAGGPAGVAAALGMPLARIGARQALTSPFVQRAVSAPLYEMSPALRMGGGLLGYAPIGGTVLGLNALGQ